MKVSVPARPVKLPTTMRYVVWVTLVERTAVVSDVRFEVPHCV